jgi:hypothetical protein
MKKVEHTPGPWTVLAAEFKGKGIVAYEIKMPEATISKANADLIAAAPDMLAALKVDEPLLMKLATVAMNEKVAEFLPFGLLDEVKEWIKSSNGQAAITKAEKQP